MKSERIRWKSITAAETINAFYSLSGDEKLNTTDWPPLFTGGDQKSSNND